MTLALASTAMVAMACGKDEKPSAAMSADLQRDLKLASATQDIRINPDEITPAAKPAQAVKPKRAPQGPKVVRTETPTKLASATPAEAAEIPSEVPEVQAMESTPAPSTTPEAPPLARPSAIPVSNTGSQGHADGGNGSGGVWGGVWGAVIRGGVVGDDDHCDPRRAPRNGRYPTSTDVYGGGIAGGGMIGRALPTRGINPRGR